MTPSRKLVAPTLGSLVNHCLVKLTLISSCALVAVPAFAQPSAQPSSTAETAPVKAPASAPKPLTVAAANVTAATLASATTFTAAGSVIILADGIVANASMAQIQSPAPGFVYER